jgi:hypothetical protein
LNYSKLFCACRPDMKKMMKADTLDMTHTELEDEDREERKNAVGNLIDIETKQDGIEMGSIRVSMSKDKLCREKSFFFHKFGFSK